MNTTLKSPFNKNKLTYQKPNVTVLNSQSTDGGASSMVQETNVNGMNVNRKMQSLGPPPS